MISKPSLRLLAALLVLVATVPTVHGQCTEPLSIYAPAPSDGDLFGNSVSVSGEWAAVGSPFHTATGSDAGAVFLYQRIGSDWNLHSTILASDASAFTHFGSDIALDDDLLLVGAPFDGQIASSAGSVYLFERTGSNWNEIAKFTASDASSGDRFGTAVAIDGDFFVVGTPQRNDGGPSTGAAYIFQRTAGVWSEEVRLAPAELEPLDKFGFDVAIDGSRIVAGAPGDDDGDDDAGAAYVYQRQAGAWIQEAKLSAGDGFVDDQAGWSVDVEGDVVVVGVPNDDDFVFSSGSVYAYFHNGTTWVEEQKIIPADSHITDMFGFSVSLSGGKLLSGAHLDDDAGDQSGSAYLFERIGTTWIEGIKVTGPDTTIDDSFGKAVALDGPYALIGSTGHDGVAQQEGAAYLFRAFVANDCDSNGEEDSCEILSGTAEDCNCNGVPDSCDLLEGTSTDLNANDVPDECEADCDGNLISDICEIAEGLATDCNGNDVPDGCDIAGLVSEDCNNNGFPDECEISELPDRDCNNNGILDSCELLLGTSTDCNSNGRPDECDTPTTPLGDCNNNGTEDPCEIVSGMCNDCNGNGVPDDCDILGSSSDGNANLVPDECEQDFRRGDSNVDGTVTIADVLFLAQYLFVVGAPDPSCFAAANANDDLVLDISDPLYLIFYLFAGGPEPPAPFTNCGAPLNPACEPCNSFPSCP